jgi:hypothetical protein
MIKGKAITLKITISNTETIRKVNLSLLSAQVKFLNFNAKISILETSKNENTVVITISTQVCVSHEPTAGATNGNEVMNNVFAGVFKPLKESVCVSSMLKIASRSAENTAIMKPK